MKANKVLCFGCNGEKVVKTWSRGIKSPHIMDCVLCNGNGFLLSIGKNALDDLLIDSIDITGVDFEEKYAETN